MGRGATLIGDIATTVDPGETTNMSFRHLATTVDTDVIANGRATLK